MPIKQTQNQPEDGLEIYIVGGAVRDSLLKIPITDRDWVVIDTTPEDMIKRGFKPIGKDFPVFLHPHTKEEYALARTEKKVKPGYQGFIFHTGPDVTLKDDLLRRDLTINAIARSKESKLVDPFNGQKDLENKTLRHVSMAFKEDPVRVMRLARFNARFDDFLVHKNTVQLVKEMNQNQELNALVPERIWQEFSKGLLEKNPLKMLHVLVKCEASMILSEIHHNLPIYLNSKKAQQYLLSRKNLPAGQKISEVASQCALLLISMQLALSEQKNHQTHFKKQALDLLNRLKAPKEVIELAQLVLKHANACLKICKELTSATKNNAENILKFIEQTDGMRKSDRFECFLTVALAHETLEEQNYSRQLLVSRWMQYLQVIKSIKLGKKRLQNKTGPEIAKIVRQERLTSITNYLKNSTALEENLGISKTKAPSPSSFKR